MKIWQTSLLVGNTLAAWTSLAATAIYTVSRKAELALKQAPERKFTSKYLVSIVIPTLQEELYLPKLLTSIKHQSYYPIEVIVVDGSPEESWRATEEICLSFGACPIHCPELNLPASRNEGAKNATGEILIFMDADCILEPDHVAKMVLELTKDYALVHPAEMFIDGLYSFVSLHFSNLLKPRTKTTRGPALWKEAFWAIGGYNESCDPMKGCREDMDLGKRIIKAFGNSSISIVKSACLAVSSRREKVFGVARVPWTARGVRDFGIIA